MCKSLGESKGECGHYNDAADDDRDVGLTNRNGARHDNNLAEWDENKRQAKGEFMRLLVSFSLCLSEMRMK